MRHFLTLLDITPNEGQKLLTRAAELKRMQKQGIPHRTLEGKTLGMIFDKSSTRTRVSFEVGMFQLGGHALFLHSGATQLGRGEPIEDSARVLSRMVDIIMIRTFGHHIVQTFAERKGDKWVLSDYHVGFQGDVELLAKARELLKSWNVFKSVVAQKAA